jgi:hypothetical protein
MQSVGSRFQASLGKKSLRKQNKQNKTQQNQTNKTKPPFFSVGKKKRQARWCIPVISGTKGSLK